RYRGDGDEQAVPAERPPSGVEELVEGHPQVGEGEQEDESAGPDRGEVTDSVALHQEGDGGHHPDEPGEDVEHRDLAVLNEQRRRLGPGNRRRDYYLAAEFLAGGRVPRGRPGRHPGGGPRGGPGWHLGGGGGGARLAYQPDAVHDQHGAYVQQHDP